MKADFCRATSIPIIPPIINEPQDGERLANSVVLNLELPRAVLSRQLAGLLEREAATPRREENIGDCSHKVRTVTKACDPVRQIQVMTSCGDCSANTLHT